MYQEFYNFSAEPFRLSPDHSFAFSHKGFNKAWTYMEYAFMRAEGFVMITGSPGVGKTTLIGALTANLAGKPVNIANLVCTQLQADDLLKMVAYEFGAPASVVDKGELLQHLTQQLRVWYREGRRALLIVDEAQDLAVSAMEELRLLTNIQLDSQPLLQIFLLGQPELRNLILMPRLEQVHQRIIAASHIKPLEMAETEAYIRHRLEKVGWRGDPAISKAVYPLAYKFSGGVPRRINLICSRLLLHCSVEGKHQIAVADVREVIQELQSEYLASGERLSETDFQVEDVFDDVLPDEKADNTPKKSGPLEVSNPAGKTEDRQPRVTAARQAAPTQSAQPAQNTPPQKSREKPVLTSPVNTAEEKPARASPVNRAEEKPAQASPVNRAEEKPAQASPVNRAEEKPARASPVNRAEEKPPQASPVNRAEEKPVLASPVNTAEEKPARASPVNKAEEKPAQRTAPAAVHRRRSVPTWVVEILVLAVVVFAVLAGLVYMDFI